MSTVGSPEMSSSNSSSLKMDISSLHGDHLVEPFQEALDLGPDGTCHLLNHLAGQLHVLSLLGLCNWNTVSTMKV